MNQELTKKNTFPWVHYYVKFCFFTFLFVGVPLIISIWFLVNNLGQLSDFLVVKPSSTILKISIWLALIYSFFGFMVSFIFYFSVFSLQIFSSQIRNFFRLPSNKRVFYKMNLPLGFEYDTRIIGRFMQDLHHGFSINNMNWSSTLRSGKYHQTVGFDYVVENANLDCYVSFAFKKQPIVIESFKKYFPQINLELVKDPFAKFPKQWSEDQTFEYEQMAGCVISHNMSEIYGTTTSDYNSGVKQNISDFLVYLGNVLPQNKFVLQYVYTFDSLLDPSYYDQRYSNIASNLLNKYSPSSSKEPLESDAFAALIPKYQVQKINDINLRLAKGKKNLVRAGIKIVSFCSDEDYAKTERALDKAIRSYFQENSSYSTDNKLGKAYLTATNQTYFNHHKVYMDLDERARFAFDRFVFLPTVLEPYFASFYNLFFYPNENRWRRKNLYVSFKNRLGYKPWSDSFCLLEFDSIDRYFQIPIVKPKVKSSVIKN